MTRLLDEVLPRWDVNEVHEIRLDATPAVAWAAVEAVLPGEVRLLAPLMAVRGLPARLRGRAPASRSPLPLLEGMQRQAFGLLGERTGEESVLGTIGRFWTLDAASTMKRPQTAAEFVGFAEPGYAKAAMDMRVVPDGAGSRVITETRIAGTDAAATRRFRRYWLVVGTGSAVIRRSWLQAIRRRAERPGGW
jgi:hypothetical protein